jgi:predicted SnoaL-like aldol condensation-catalyzing enzyme
MTLPHIERAKKVWEEFFQGNIAAGLELYRDDVVIHFSGRHKFSGDVKGKEALMDYYVKFFEAFPGFQMEPHAITGDEDHLIQLVKTTYVQGDESQTDNMAIISHIGDDGKIVEEWWQDGDQYAVDEFVNRFYPPE